MPVGPLEASRTAGGLRQAPVLHDSCSGELLRNFYGALGLRPEASDDEIKAAFRKLAKQYHPDLNAGDKRAEEQFKEVNEAHAILSDPGARACYDASLSQRRLLRRQRSRSAAAIMAASFALTVTVIFSTAILLQQYGDGLSRFSAGWQATESPAAPRRRGVAISEAVDRQRAVALPRTERPAETEAASPGQLVEGPLVRPQSPGLIGATPAGPNFGSDAWVPETDRAAVSAVEVQQEPRVTFAVARWGQKCLRRRPRRSHPAPRKSTIVKRCRASSGQTGRAGPAIEIPFRVCSQISGSHLCP